MASHRAKPALSLSKLLSLSASLLMGIGAPFAVGVFHSQGTAVPVPRLQFDAASIRIVSAGQARDQQLPIGLHCRGSDGELFPLPSDPPSTAPMGRCTGVTDGYDLIMRAYAHTNYAYFRTINLPDEFGVPSGPDSPLYDIHAIAPDPSITTKSELQEMLQSLLRDRFNFKAHYETRDVDGFQMTVAKGGVKFKETSLDEESCCRLLSPSGTGNPAVEGGVWVFMIKGRFRMAQMAQFLSTFLGRPLDAPPVTDTTNLPSVYDITLLLNQILPITDGGGRGGGGSREPFQFDPSLPKAVEEQLGLHLEAVKVPVKYLVIDHIERPSPN